MRAHGISVPRFPKTAVHTWLTLAGVSTVIRTCPHIPGLMYMYACVERPGVLKEILCTYNYTALCAILQFVGFFVLMVNA